MFGQQWFESALRLLLLPPAFIQTTPFSFFTRGNNDRPWRTAEPTIFSQKNVLTHIITENSLSKVISERKEPCFVLNFFSGEVMSQFSIWAKLCAEKTLFAHPFKLKVLAVLYVRNGEVMVIPTTPPAL